MNRSNSYHLHQGTTKQNRDYRTTKMGGKSQM